MSLLQAVAAGLTGRAARAQSVLVVGGGVGGLTLAWALARRGHLVRLVDAGSLPGTANSSADESRIIRHAYGTMLGYAALMPTAHHAWAALFAETGAVRRVATRAVYPIHAEGPWQAAVTATLAAQGFAARVLDAAALDALPMLNREGLLRAVEIEGSGLLLAAPILADLVAWLGPRATLHANSPVAAVGDGQVRLADGTTLTADQVVVAAGTQNIRLLPEAARAAGLRASLQTLVYLDPPEELRAAWQDSPIISCRLPGHPTGGVAVLPPRQGSRLKLGDYATDTDADPDTQRPPPNATNVNALLDAGSRAIAGFERYRVSETRHCLYTMAPEDRFVFAPAGARTHMLSACSGHGFKLAPLVALAVTAALEERLGAADAAHLIAGHEAA